MRGQSLTETLVAISVALIILTMTTVAIITSLKNAQVSKTQNQATQYLQQGVEIVRQMRNASWTEFSNYSGAYCMASACTALSSSGQSCGPKVGSCGQNVGNFIREVSLTRNAIECNSAGDSGNLINTKAVVTVYWSDSSCQSGVACKKSSMESCLANIYGDPDL